MQGVNSQKIRIDRNMKGGYHKMRKIKKKFKKNDMKTDSGAKRSGQEKQLNCTRKE